MGELDDVTSNNAMVRIFSFLLLVAVLGLIQIPIAAVVMYAEEIKFVWTDFFKDGALIIYSLSISGAAAYTLRCKDKDSKHLLHIMTYLVLFVVVAGALIYGVKLADAFKAKAVIALPDKFHFFQMFCSFLALFYYIIVEFFVEASNGRKHTKIKLVT